MIKKFKWLLIITLIISTVGSLSYQVEGQSEISLTKLEGTVQYKGSSWWFFSAPWKQITGSTALDEGDKIKTGPQGRAELEFNDQAQILIKPNSKVQVTANESGEVELKKLKLNLGEVIVKFIDELNEGSTFEVETPSAVAGIKGTTFKVAVNQQQQTTVTVNQGTVKVSTEVGSVEVKQGQAAHVADKAEEPEVKPAPEAKNWEEKERWINRVNQWEKRAKEKPQTPPGQQKKEQVGPPEQANDHKPDTPADDKQKPGKPEHIPSEKPDDKPTPNNTEDEPEDDKQPNKPDKPDTPNKPH